MFKKEDTYNYKGWMHSGYLIKRAFATWGHVIVATSVFYAALLIVAAVVGLIMLGLGAL